jgi:multiple sugar transport system substrate-binding protein
MKNHFKLSFISVLVFVMFIISPIAKAYSSAQIAVDAAKKMCNGKVITIVSEAGPQSLDPKKFSGPLWEKLTGCKISVVEVPTAQMYSKIIKAFHAGRGNYDVLNVVPAWMPDLVQAGALEQLDNFVDKYSYRDELNKIASTFRDNQMKVDGKIFGLPDDGDVFIMYYRKDIFSDVALQKAFKAKFNYELSPPTTWKQFSEIGQFLTDKLQTKHIYGASQFRGSEYSQYLFQERYRNEGGKFFDDNMKAQINSPLGIKVLTDWKNENKFMPPGVEKFGFNENLATFLNGESAMTISWPPYGRFAAGYIKDVSMKWVPTSKINGKVGYALPPGGHPQLALGFSLSVASNSKNKELAYLFMQWLNSEEISTQRVQLPYSLRDPFRDSHYSSKTYLGKWPDAKYYLETLHLASKVGLIDLSLIHTDKYEQDLRKGIDRLWMGGEPKAILDDVAMSWDKTTQQVGVEKQKHIYNIWAAKAGAYPR